MFKIILVLVLSPLILIAATMLICAIIGAGFDALIKVVAILLVIAIVRYIFALAKEKESS